MPNDNSTITSSDDTTDHANPTPSTTQDQTLKPDMDIDSIPAPISAPKTSTVSAKGGTEPLTESEVAVPIIPGTDTDDSENDELSTNLESQDMTNPLDQSEHSSTDDDTVPTRDGQDSLDSSPSIYGEIVRRISEAKNVLIALSSNPSVDEMAAAIGLSLYLDKLGKRATAIYSGTTPNALEFLKPEETFEPSADTLQDFVIALSKEKADHLRYKLDGSYVKIYITPFRSRIAEEDLDFSYGDYNVDLVLALDVANGIDLDSALREHGRIMHDAAIINISTGKPGKFGEIEWNDRNASSISEMISELLYSVDSEVKVGKEEATAFLTGIVAATNRFSNSNTTPETMRISSLLMESGANQQLVSKNITPDMGDELASSAHPRTSKEKEDSFIPKSEYLGSLKKEHKADNADESTQKEESDLKKDSGLLDDLRAAAESLSHTGAETTPETAEEPFKISSLEAEAPSAAEKEIRESSASEKDVSTASKPASVLESQNMNVKNELSSAELPKPDLNIVEKKDENIGMSEPSAGASTTELFAPKQPSSTPEKQSTNPIMSNVPNVPTHPEVNSVPDISYMPMPSDSVLPPPPTPPIGEANSVPPVPPVSPFSTPLASSENTSAPAESQVPAPAPIDNQSNAQNQSSSTAQPSDPGAFKIPGM